MSLCSTFDTRPVFAVLCSCSSSSGRSFPARGDWSPVFVPDAETPRAADIPVDPMSGPDADLCIVSISLFPVILAS
ncbi:hypothetical protein PGT21_019626 [Puccinia graminis f. sp. tritici]|uniref:Uncharacterized protein n=1 Tax=Puccinia graminis f. sp. tritici TaxID=56615 RepID=A0A5B0R1D7_PUCGR|nr:hypothetical protein PGT21_019626 [Puccinia graminis f. sp. tritici]